MTRLHEALTFLGALYPSEASCACGCSLRQVQRFAKADGIGRDDEGRYSLSVSRTSRPPRPSVVAIQSLVADGGDVYADWIAEQTGVERRSVYEALRELGFTARRGRGAVWSRKRAE